MQVEIESLDGLERKLTIGLPATQIDQEVNQRLQSAAANVRMNGFRPGKVPMSVVRKKYGPGIRQEVLADLVQKSFQQVIEEKDLRPAGTPAVARDDEEGSDEVRFVCTFEVMPEVKLPDYSALTVDKPACSIGDSDLDTMIEQLRERRPDWAEVERAAADGDQVKADFVGRLDGVEFPGGTGEGIEFVIGGGNMLPDFETGVLGAKAGEERVFPVGFPEDYQAKELAGQTAEFTVTVVSVSEKALPEVNAEFFKAWGVDTDDLEKFRTEVRETMENEVGRVVKQRMKTEVIDKLLENTPVELPASLVDAELKRQNPEAQAHDHDHEHCDDPTHDHSHEHHEHPADDEQREAAEKRVRTGLILMEVIRSEGLKADAGRVREMIEQIAKPYGEPEQIMNWYYSDQQRLSEIESAVLEEQVVEVIAGRAQVAEQPATYEELVGAAALAG